MFGSTDNSSSATEHDILWVTRSMLSVTPNGNQMKKEKRIRLAVTGQFTTTINNNNNNNNKRIHHHFLRSSHARWASLSLLNLSYLSWSDALNPVLMIPLSIVPSSFNRTS